MKNGASCPSLPPLPSLEGGGFEDLFNADVLKEAGIQAGTTAAGILVLSAASDKFLKDKAWGGDAKSAGAILLSFLGASYLKDSQPEVARGLLGVAGFALAEWVAARAFAASPSIHSGMPITKAAPVAGLLGIGKSSGVAGYEQYLGGGGVRAALGAGEDSVFEAAIETRQDGGDFAGAGVSVEEDNELRGLVASL